MDKTLDLYYEFLVNKGLQQISIDKEMDKLSGLIKYEQVFDKKLYEFEVDDIETMLYLLKSPSSLYIRTILGNLKAFTEQLKEKGIVGYNNYSKIPNSNRNVIKYTAKNKIEEKYLEKEELEQLIEDIKSYEGKSIVILLSKGIDLNEQVNIKMSDIKKDRVKIGDIEVILSEKEINYINKFMNILYDEYTGNEYIDNGYLYRKTNQSNPKEPLKYMSLYKRFKNYVKNVGFNYINPRDISDLRYYYTIKDKYPTREQFNKATTIEINNTVKEVYPEFGITNTIKGKIENLNIYKND